MRTIVFNFMAILVATHLSAGQETPTQGKWIGMWKLNLSKSTFPPGDPERPISVTRKIVAIPGGMRFSTERVNSRGVYLPRQLEFEVLYDGNEVRVSGSAALPGQTVSARAVDQFTYELSWTIPGVGTAFERGIVSSDGRTLTITARQTVRGQVTNPVSVYELEP